jgi:hypothetical protein
MVAKKAGKSRKGGEQLNPLVKSWLDDVIIPALVEEYIEMQKKNRLGATSDSEKLLLSVIWSRTKGQSSQGLIADQEEKAKGKNRVMNRTSLCQMFRLAETRTALDINATI